MSIGLKLRARAAYLKLMTSNYPCLFDVLTHNILRDVERSWVPSITTQGTHSFIDRASRHKIPCSFSVGKECQEFHIAAQS